MQPGNVLKLSDKRNSANSVHILSPLSSSPSRFTMFLIKFDSGTHAVVWVVSNTRSKETLVFFASLCELKQV